MKPMKPLGACLLLTITLTWAKTNSQKQAQYGIWNSEPAKYKFAPEDFMIEETEGSGKEGVIEHTHGDDEDFEVASGNGPDKGISTNEPDIDTGTAVTEATKDKNVQTGISDDEDLVAGSGSGQGPVEDDTTESVDNLGSAFKGVSSTPTPKILTPCENLRLRSLNLTQFVPECDTDGAFKKRQCRTEKETYCWCVDLVGTEIPGTMFKEPNRPDCENAAMKVTTKSSTFKAIATKTATIKPLDKDNTVTDIKEENIDVKIHGKVEVDEKDDETDEQVAEINHEPTMHEPILAQPGLLAAIIGGAIVGLLCIVFLMMFIVYRMRKKDVGSYPLDEQKYQNYTYTKAPEKEFLA